MTFSPEPTPEEETSNRTEKYFRFRAAGRITGRELVDAVLGFLAQNGQSGQVADVTRKLMVQDSVDVSDWLVWIEPRYGDPHRATSFTWGDPSSESNQQQRDKFGQVAEIVRSVVGEDRTSLESEGIRDV